jgi:hypothetical protein
MTFRDLKNREMRTTGDNKHNSIGVTPPNDLIKVANVDNKSEESLLVVN